MINYRVENIEKLVDDLKNEGVEILDEIENNRLQASSKIKIYLSKEPTFRFK